MKINITDTPNLHYYYLHSTVPQNLPPTISFSKRQFYIGEKLVANCTTARAKPGKQIIRILINLNVNQNTHKVHKIVDKKKQFFNEITVSYFFYLFRSTAYNMVN